MRQDKRQGAGATLANFVAATSWADVAAQSHEAKRSILNFFATALGSAYDPAVTSALRTLAPFSGAATSAIVGRSERLDALGAAFINAISANLLDFDDTHLDTIIHPAAPVAAPVLALAQARGLSGRDVMMAFILGVEVECRIGNAVSPGPLRPGLAYHVDLRGVRRGRRLRQSCSALPADGITNAIGIAASQSAGIVENLPTAAKNVSVGNAARNGLFAALLAAEGYDASARAIEGPLGWARAMGDEPDLERLVGGLGKSWEIAKNTYKPYPAGHRLSCRHRRLLQAAGEAQSASRRDRIRHGAGLGALARPRRSSRFATSAMRGSAFIIASPARCCSARRACRNLPNRWYFA